MGKIGNNQSIPLFKKIKSITLQRKAATEEEKTNKKLQNNQKTTNKMAVVILNHQ